MADLSAIDAKLLSLRSLSGEIKEMIAEMPCVRCGAPLGIIDECVEVEERNMAHSRCVKVDG